MDNLPSMLAPTREVFGNIAPWMRAVFYALMFASMGVLALRLASRVRLWKRGVAGGFETDWRAGMRRLWVFAVGQKRVHRRSLGAVLHALLASGFTVLTIGTTLLMISHAGPVEFHHGWYYLIYELTMDVFGLAFCVGCVLAMWRRGMARPAHLGHRGSDWVWLSLLLALGVTGFLIEALRLRYTGVEPEVGRWSVVGWAMSQAVLESVPIATAQSLHLGIWWSHSIMVAGFIAFLPVSRMLHVLTGPLNIAARPSRAVGALAPLTVEDVERTGRTGVGSIEHFNQQQLLSLDACMECGRCEEACPAFASGKPLSPKRLILDLRRDMEAGPGPERRLLGGAVSAETMWACTMCQACVQECPVLIGHVDLISDLRRFAVGEGQFSGPPATAIRNVTNRFNPYGRPQTERLAWAQGLDVPTVDSNPGYEYLFWVGCAASFDPRAQKVARSTAQLLKAAGVNYAVLGTKERCTGDPARRVGDEFAFQELAGHNVRTMDTHRTRKVVTGCPHCYNTLRNEYPALGGTYEVQHHSQLLSELLAAGRLKSAPGAGSAVTLHDPCYLARANGEVTAPRTVLAGAGAPLREMPRHGKKTFCCGAGGGRMWAEEPPAQRVSALRAAEAAGTGAGRLATGCPFCLNMMTDAVAAGGSKTPLEVLDIAELLLERQPPALARDPATAGAPPVG